MYNREIYINKPLSYVECVFREHNQPTVIYMVHQDKKRIVDKFGTNEGGPSYSIYVNKEHIVVKIDEIDMLSFLDR